MNQSVGYASEPVHDYNQRDYYYPPRSNTTERRYEAKQEPRLLHYYTGYDYFATLDPLDQAFARHHPSATGIRPLVGYNVNSSYYPESDYIKSIL